MDYIYYKHLETIIKHSEFLELFFHAPTERYGAPPWTTPRLRRSPFFSHRSGRVRTQRPLRAWQESPGSWALCVILRTGIASWVPGKN